ncbi:hypothetical protein RvY_02144 [Ramazzottius varieornatus]|uniref:serine--tRNA ligase n=1 Tax=Ramazzottius varieornatus TaxID=947166 RepID=A0A1D1UPN0_RAMVA|nr:hypothetical protein RvY_02144 [Ramazzottius varieornatus]
MRAVWIWTRLSRWNAVSTIPRASDYAILPKHSFHTSSLFLKTKEKDRTVFQTTDFIPPRTALFVSGSSSQFATFVVDPHFDFDERFADLDNYQQEITLRQLSFDLHKCSALWTRLQELWKRRAELETRRKQSVENFSKPSDVDEESKLKGRLLRGEIKQLNKDIAEIEIDTITTLLKLPVRLHKYVPMGNNPFVSFDTTADQEVQFMECSKLNSNSVNAANRVARREKVRVEAHDVNKALQQSRLVEYTDEAPRGYFLRGQAAELELKLLNYGRSFLEEKGYSGISGPHLYRSVVVEGTGFISDDHDDVSATTGSLINVKPNQPFLIDTVDTRGSLFRSLFLTNSTVNLYAAHFTNCEAAENILPIRLHSSSRVYRAVSNKGLEEEEDEKYCRIFRPSQTHTVSFCTAFTDAETTEEYLTETLELFKSFYLSLGLRFRLVSLPASKLGISEALRYELKVWSPLLSEFVPCGHIAFHDDFVSKRLRCHVDKPEQNKFLRFFTGSLLDLTPFVACCIDGSEGGIFEHIRRNPACVL